MCERCPLKNSFARSDQILVIRNGEEYAYSRGSSEYNSILSAWDAMLENAFQMPAFGVCIDKLTRAEKEKGLWVEFVFSEKKEHNGMPFERLLVAVKPEFRGFNIERYNDGAYGGRCFYIDLGKEDMRSFYDAITKL